MNISVLALLIILKSLEAPLLLLKPPALDFRAATAGSVGLIGSDLLISMLPHLDVCRDVEGGRCGCAVMVVVKVLCVRREDELEVANFCVCLDADRPRAVDWVVVPEWVALGLVSRIDPLLSDSVGCVDSPSSICFA